MASSNPNETTTSSRVLLVNLNRYDQPYPVYPIGLAYVDGALREAGFVSQLWDGWSASKTLEATIAEFAPTHIGLSLRNIDNVQCHNPHTFVHDLVQCCKTIRSCTKAPIILGGAAFSVFPRELMHLTQADFGVQGEGEVTIVELLRALEGGKPLDAIPGLLHRTPNGEVTGLQTCKRNTAAFSHRPYHTPSVLARYTQKGGLPGIQTQRGCPLRCCYCTYPLIEGLNSRFRSPENVVGEMRRLSELGVRYAFIVDSVFNTSERHLVAVCEALERAKLDLQWECFLRPKGITREMLSLMQRAGLRHIEFGSDSLSDSVLTSYGKSFSFADVSQASEHAHALGLHYSHFLIFGGPGETPATVVETLDRAATLPGAFFFATIGMRIYPGTHLWARVAPESKGESAADYLIEPRFFLEPAFSVESLHTQLTQIQCERHNWVVGDPPPAFVETMEKLRTRGIRGPMWEYIELLQRYSFSRPNGNALAAPK